MREWLRKRYKYGAYYQLLKEVQLLDTSGIRNFLRMSSSAFEERLQNVGPKISYKLPQLLPFLNFTPSLSAFLKFVATCCFK